MARSIRQFCAEGDNKKLKDKLEDVKAEKSLRWILHAISPTALMGKGQFAQARLEAKVRNFESLLPVHLFVIDYKHSLYLTFPNSTKSQVEEE